MWISFKCHVCITNWYFMSISWGFNNELNILRTVWVCKHMMSKAITLNCISVNKYKNKKDISHILWNGICQYYISQKKISKCQILLKSHLNIHRNYNFTDISIAFEYLNTFQNMLAWVTNHQLKTKNCILNQKKQISLFVEYIVSTQTFAIFSLNCV